LVIAVGRAVGFAVAVKPLDQFEDLRWWLRHLDGEYLGAGRELKLFGGLSFETRGAAEADGVMRMPKYEVCHPLSRHTLTGVATRSD
jgi:hypothetical protein